MCKNAKEENVIGAVACFARGHAWPVVKNTLVDTRMADSWEGRMLEYGRWENV